MSELHTPEFIAARNAAMARYTGWIGHDAMDPTGPSGHAYGLAVSTRLTSYYRTTHRKGAMDITPQQVIDCLVAANVKEWVLMGLHGYVGYLPMPRATQDVDVMVPFSQREKKRPRQLRLSGHHFFDAICLKSFDSWIVAIWTKKANRSLSST